MHHLVNIKYAFNLVPVCGAVTIIEINLWDTNKTITVNKGDIYEQLLLLEITNPTNCSPSCCVGQYL